MFLQATSAPVHYETDLETAEGTADISLKDYKSWPLYIDTIKRITDDLARSAVRSFSNITCTTCRYGVKLLQEMFDHKFTHDAIADAVEEVCILAKIQDESVCKGIVKVFKVRVCVFCV